MLTIKSTAADRRSVYWRFAPDRSPVLLGKLRFKRATWHATDRDNKPIGRFPTVDLAAMALREQVVGPLVARALGRADINGYPSPGTGAAHAPVSASSSQPPPHPLYGRPPWASDAT